MNRVLPDEQRMKIAKNLVKNEQYSHALEILFDLAKKEILQADCELFNLIRQQPEQVLPLYEKFAAQGNKLAQYFINEYED